MPGGRRPEHVVAIGASAGGLEALLEMLPLVQPSPTTRYILAQHMARSGHAELVIRVLGRKARMPVVEAHDDDVVEPGVLYVLPPACDGRYLDGRIRIGPAGPGNLSAPSVNELFVSVAHAAGPNAVAVVLSGAGSDGVVGCRAIRQRHGLVLVQAQAGAGIGGMPGSVAAAGLADAELSPADIAKRLNALAPPTAAIPRRAPDHSSEPMARLMQRLSQHSGVDFTQYRLGTTLRRMDRRRASLTLPDLDTYVTYALAHDEELDVLFGMFMISWSWFLRDRDAWECLRGALSTLLREKPVGEEFVAWVPGCATGEEAYTLAMLVRELDPDRPVRIIGTDINAKALAQARLGAYPAKTMRELPAAMAERWFERSGSEWQIHRALRDACTFLEQDAIRVAPEEVFDVVTCRNLLIYLRQELQAPLLAGIRERLRSGGLLFIGLAETLPRGEVGHYAAVDTAMRVYRRRSAS